MTFDPTSVEVTCVTLPKDHCVQVPWKYIKVYGYSDLFCKKILNQRSLTPRWPLTPHLLRSHVWLYPRIIVSKSHENTSKYVDTVNLFAKTWTKGHWPLDDLWPHTCWGHMCDSTQGSLCPSPMGIHQCMWIQWSILQKLPHTYTYYIHTYYILRTYYVQNQWSHSLFLNYVQVRQQGGHDRGTSPYHFPMWVPPPRSSLAIVNTAPLSCWYWSLEANNLLFCLVYQSICQYSEPTNHI